MPDGNAARAQHVECAARYGLPFLDVYHLIKRIAGIRPDIDTGSLFLDDMHISDALCGEVAAVLAASVSRLDCREQTEEEVAAPAAAFAYLPFSSNEAFADLMRERKTSLLTSSFLPVNEEGVAVSVPHEASVVGFAIDYAHANGILSISGMSEVMSSVTTKHLRDDDNKCIFAITPLPVAVESTAGSVFLRAIARAKDDALGRTTTALQEQTAPCADVAGLVLRLPSEARSCRRRSSEAWDIVSGLTDAEVGRIAERLAPTT